MKICFDLFNQKIEFDEHLKKYYQIKVGFNNQYFNILKNKESLFFNKKDVSDLVAYIQEELQNIAKGIIKSLSYYGIYNKTIDDLLNSNQGYIDIFNTISTYTEILKEFVNERDKFTESQLQNAKQRAESQITGLDFGIVSNSIAAHVLYAAQQDSELKKQKRKATEQYNRESSTILQQIDKVTNDKLDEYYKDEFIPNFKNSLKKCIDLLFDSYICELSNCGQINLECSKQLNFERSASLLQNINIIDDIKKLICEVVQTCPFDINLYCIAFENNIFNDELIKIAQYFDMTKEIIESIAKTNNIYFESFTQNIEEYCENNYEYFSFFSKLENKKIESYKKEFTENSYVCIKNNIKNTICILNSYIQNETNYENLADEIKDGLLDRIKVGIITQYLINKKEFKYLIEQCNHLDFYEEISEILENKIETIEDLNNHLNQIIHSKIKIYEVWCERDKIQKQIAIEKKKKESLRVQEKQQEIKQENQKTKQRLIKGSIVFFSAIFLVFTSIIVYNTFFKPYDKDILEYFNNYSFDDISGNSMEKNEEILKYENKRVKDKFLKKQYNLFIKGCKLQNKGNKNEDVWIKGIRYKLNALSNLSAKKIIKYDQEEIEDIIAVIFKCEMYEQCKKEDWQLNISDDKTITIPIKNSTGYDIKYASFSFEIKGRNFRTRINNWNNNTKENIVFQLNSMNDEILSQGEKVTFSASCNYVTIK